MVPILGRSTRLKICEMINSERWIISGRSVLVFRLPMNVASFIDLKPENIMLDRETDVLKVADFGLAYFVDRDVGDAVWDTRTHDHGYGCLHAPEQGRR